MVMSPATCGHCRSSLRIHTLNTGKTATCPSCYEKGYGYVYPAWYKTRDVSITREVAVDGDASCFFHDTQKANAACEGCGKFICSVCRIDYAGTTHCPECIGQERAKGVSLQIQSKRYDRLALLLSLLPLTVALWFFAPITAIASLYLSIRYWSKQEGLVPRNRWRFVTASLLSVATLAGFAAMIFQMTQ